LHDADVVFTATAATEPVIDQETMRAVQSARQHRSMIVLDLAVPRDVEPACGQIAGVTLIDVDRVASTDDQPAGALIARASAAVDAGVADFVAWHRQRLLGPMIEQLYARGRAAAMNASPDGTASAIDDERHVRQHVNRLLHGPVAELKRAQRRLVDDPADADALATVRRIAALFKLPVDEDDPIDDDLPL
jgi:glutamyl-tRNA reductase